MALRVGPIPKECNMSNHGIALRIGTLASSGLCIYTHVCVTALHMHLVLTANDICEAFWQNETELGTGRSGENAKSRMGVIFYLFLDLLIFCHLIMSTAHILKKQY